MSLPLSNKAFWGHPWAMRSYAHTAWNRHYGLFYPSSRWRFNESTGAPKWFVSGGGGASCCNPSYVYDNAHCIYTVPKSCFAVLYPVYLVGWPCVTADYTVLFVTYAVYLYHTRVRRAVLFRSRGGIYKSRYGLRKKISVVWFKLFAEV
jgi:hypothetical protein